MELVYKYLNVFVHPFPVWYQGKPAILEDTNNPDWVPSLKMGYHVATSRDSHDRYTRLQTRNKRRRIDAENITSIAEWESEVIGCGSDMTGCESGMLYVQIMLLILQPFSCV